VFYYPLAPEGDEGGASQDEVVIEAHPEEVA